MGVDKCKQPKTIEDFIHKERYPIDYECSYCEGKIQHPAAEYLYSLVKGEKHDSH